MGVRSFFRRLFKGPAAGSAQYWESRYRRGRDSGAGSYGRLAEFKAEFLNGFVEDRGVASVIEFGCGDGHQLSLARYPSYVGLDVSRQAIGLCAERFADDPTRSFYLYDSPSFVDHHRLFRAELALSLDVIYHLVEDEVFHAYLSHVFAAATRFVIVFSSDEDRPQTVPHVRHRKFTSWVSEHAPEWTLTERVPNRYPYDEGNHRQTSFADFHVFEKTAP